MNLPSGQPRGGGIFYFLIAMAMWGFPHTAWSWGDRGHHAVSVLASKRMAELTPERAFWTHWAYVLGQLSNVPDQAWKRSGSSRLNAVRTRERVTHYLNTEVMDALVPGFLTGDTVRVPDLAEARALFFKKWPKKDFFEELGLLPWRIEGLAARMTQTLERSKKTGIKDLREAVFVAGILAHYVGDAAQPLHVASDYDGQKAGLSGIHAYFEIQVLNTSALTLEHQAWVRMSEPEFQKRAQKIFQDQIPIRLGLSNLIRDSRSRLDALFEIDRKVSVQSGSSQRKAPESSEVQKAYEGLLVDRIAMAAWVLSELWHRAWVDAGRPAWTRIGPALGLPFPYEVPYLEGP